MVLCLMVTAAVSFASDINQRPASFMKIVGSTWHEYVTSDGGAYNGNVWVNVWPEDKLFGGYGYVQYAPNYTQMYGGGAVHRGAIEAGVGIGVENSDGSVQMRNSAYGILTIGAFNSANWIEHSKQGGTWALSQDMYTINDNVEAGFRLQRFLGGGPMVRLTQHVSRYTLQQYLALMYDGDGLNPALGVTLNF